MKVCAQCDNYIGGGDWGLCCKCTYDLVYEETSADDCQNFVQKKECINASSHVGMFRCSICGAYCREERVFDTCPRCDNVITGGHWAGQKHWKGERK